MEVHYYSVANHVNCDDCCKDVTCAELLGMPCTVYTTRHLYDNADVHEHEGDWLGDD